MAESDVGMSAAVPSGTESAAQSRAPADSAFYGIVGVSAPMPLSHADLIEENALLQEAVAARGSFLAVAAHELRNPMTPIVGRVVRLRRLLREPDLRPETLEKSLEQIE